jgi:hypothetical protein
MKAAFGPVFADQGVHLADRQVKRNALKRRDSWKAASDVDQTQQGGVVHGGFGWIDGLVAIRLVSCRACAS